MKKHLFSIVSIVFVLLMLLGAASASAHTTLTVVENRVTMSSNYESTPTLGNDGTGDLVVYTSRELLNTGLFDQADIYYQPLVAGQAVGAPVQVTTSLTDDVLNDVNGNNIVYTAHDGPFSNSGTVMLYNIATGQRRTLGQAGIVRDPKIHGDYVVWLQGSAATSEVILYDITTNVGISLAGPVPPASQVQIGSRFIVWSSDVGTSHDIWVFDFELNTRYQLTNTPIRDERYPSTSGDWVAWQVADRVTAGPTVIEAYNGQTGEMRTIVDDGAFNRMPSLDDGLIAWESNAAGNFDVWVHRLDTSESFQVTFEPGDQYLNDLYAGLVAYVDARFGNEDIFVSTLQFSTPQSCAGPTTGLVGCYQFNGNAADGSGNALHGILHGAPAFTAGRAGNPGGALLLDGVNDYVELPGEGSFDLPEFTVSAIVKVPDYSRENWLVTKGTNSGNYTLMILDSTHQYWPGYATYTHQTSTGNWSSLASDGPVPTGEFFHLAVTLSGTEFKAYVNGNLVQSATNPEAPVFNNYPVTIGAGGYYDLSDFFAGAIDELRIYNRPLTGDEVCALYNDGFNTAGTADCNDLCPNDPAKTAPGICGCGVADTDSDGDGTADCNDVCSGFDDLTDGDGDGVPDGCDLCQGDDASGDTDSDGVCNDTDNCPLDISNDADADGVCPSDGDCDDNNPNVHPGSKEICNGIDDNCNGSIDESLGTTTCGLGLCSHMINNCVAGVPQICNPFEGVATEICDGLDNDCDGVVDDGVKLTFYRDSDGDTFGDPVNTTTACSPPAGFVTDNTDCDDSFATVFPGGNEICDGLDNDCNPATTDGSQDPQLNMACDGPDSDLCIDDTFSCANGELTCSTGTDDLEVCDGTDNNCDGVIDEGFDQDGDGYTVCGGDCDDSDGSKNPGTLSIFEVKKAEVDWDNDHGTLAKVKVNGTLALSCGDFYQTNPVGSATIGISSVPNLIDESVSFTVKGDGKKWEYKDESDDIGIEKFKLDLKGAKFEYLGDIKIKSEHIGYDNATIEIDWDNVTEAFRVEIGDVTIDVDAAGVVTAYPETLVGEVDVDEDKEIEVELLFPLSPDTPIIVQKGDAFTEVMVGDYYTTSTAKFEIKGLFNPNGLTSATRPATLDLSVRIGDDKSTGTFNISDGDWDKLGKDWKFKK